MEAIKIIKNLCLENKWEKILIVSHNRILKYVSGRENGGKVPGLANCEIRFTHF